MTDSPSISSPQSGDRKFKIHDFVWAKVKGFSYWPAQVCEGENIKCSRKLKNPYCVFFFGSNNYAWVGEDSIKPYEEFREQYAKLAKTQIFRSAIAKIEEQISNSKGGKPLEPLLNLSAISNTSNVSSTQTPEIEKSESLFRAKKPNSSTPIQRDYSRTPFKKDKRNFETSIEVESKKSSTKLSVESSEKKRLKVAHQTPPKKSYNSAKHNESSFKAESPDSSYVEEKMEDVSAVLKSPKKPSNLKFGFIGLGKMGQQLLKHFINSGHDITIWNRTPSKCKEFEKLGANVVKTPGDVVRESDITFSCLSDAKASSSIFFGNCGVLHEINASKGYVELTSIDFSTSIEIEAAVKSKGGRYLEAPVLICSIPKQIEEGKLVAMVAGNRSLFDDCGSCFEAICSHVYFLSENAGTGSKMNIVISTLYGNVIGSLIECMTLVERLGLIQKDFVEIISHSALNSPLIESKIPSMIDSTLIRDIPIDHIRRDLSYCLNLANVKNYTTPITATTNEVFKQKKHHYY